MIAMKCWIIGVALAASSSFARAEEIPAAPNVDGLISRLNDDAFANREQAGNDLLAYGKTHSDEVGRALVAAFRASPEPEIRQRSKDLLRKLFFGSIGYVGVYYTSDATLENDGSLRRGVRVNQVSPKSPAAAADLRPGDLILGIDGHLLDANTPDLDFAQRVQMRAVGQEVKLKILRGPDEVEIKVTLAERTIPLAPTQAEALFDARLKELERVEGK